MIECSHLKELTRAYVKAFDRKDLEGVSALLHDDICLSDPNFKNLSPKVEVMDMIGDLFSAYVETFAFTAKNIFQDNDVTFIEFELVLDKTSLVGVDVIHWENNKIKQLDAYLY